MKSFLITFAIFFAANVLFAHQDTLNFSDLNFERNIDDTTLIKFKAKGAKLDLEVDFGPENFDYEIVPLKPELYKTYSERLPVKSTVPGVLDQNIWRYSIETGQCACTNCVDIHRLVTDSVPPTFRQENEYLIKIFSKGILKVKAKWREVDPSLRVFNLEDDISHIDVGMHYELREVKFRASSTAYLGNAQKELKKLLAFLEKNEKVSISIEGHVNGPFNSNPKGFQTLSLARAEKIKDYLVKNGIAEQRIAAVGKGNTMMRFKKPVSEWQAEQNRRVEVRLTKK